MSADHSHYTHDDNPYLGVPSLDDSTDAIDLPALLGQSTGLELEVGFGRGKFIRGRAAALPQVKILGIETKRKLVYLCQEKATAAGIANLMVVHGDAREAVRRMGPDGCLDRVFIHFPDPWWKARHQKRKVVSDQMTAELVRLLRPGGEYFVQTDVEFRAQEYHQILLQNPHLSPMGDAGLVADNPFFARSSREERAMDLGMPVHRLLFTRR